MFLKTSSVVILKTIILFKSLLLSYENIDVFYKVLVLTFSCLIKENTLWKVV